MPKLFMDSQSALSMCKDPVYHERSKHIDVMLHFIRDLEDDKIIEILKIPGRTNPADFETKVVPVSKFVFCKETLKVGAVS